MITRLAAIDLLQLLVEADQARVVIAVLADGDPAAADILEADQRRARVGDDQLADAGLDRRSECDLLVAREGEQHIGGDVALAGEQRRIS